MNRKYFVKFLVFDECQHFEVSVRIIIFINNNEDSLLEIFPIYIDHRDSILMDKGRCKQRDKPFCSFIKFKHFTSSLST